MPYLEFQLLCVLLCEGRIHEDGHSHSYICWYQGDDIQPIWEEAQRFPWVQGEEEYICEALWKKASSLTMLVEDDVSR